LAFDAPTTGSYTIAATDAAPAAALVIGPAEAVGSAIVIAAAAVAALGLALVLVGLAQHWRSRSSRSRSRPGDPILS